MFFPPCDGASFGTVGPVETEANATQEIDRLIVQVQQRMDQLLKARSLVSGTEPRPDSEADDEPKDKPDAILKVLRMSRRDDLSPMAIWGALDTRGWLTEKDYADDTHFYKTLATMYEDGRLVKPRRGQYALRDRLPAAYGDPALNGSPSVESEVLLEET